MPKRMLSNAGLSQHTAYHMVADNMTSVL